MNLTSVNEVLTFAIRKEADSAAFYRLAAARGNPAVREAFEDLAKEEDGHKRRLETIDLKTLAATEVKERKGLGIAEMFSDTPYSSDMSYADVLRLAMKNEEASCHTYISASESVSDPAVKKLLLVLAQEEAGHKERLEKIYDSDILQEF